MKKNINIKLNKRKSILSKKRNKIIVGLFLFSLLLVAGLAMYDNYSTMNDKNEVNNMRENVHQIVKKMQSMDQRVTWIDSSHCTIYKPRLFGGDVRYSCDASYDGRVELSDDVSIESVVDKSYAVLKANSDMTTPVVYPEKNLQISPNTIVDDNWKSIDFTLLGVSTEKCDMSYAVESRDTLAWMKLYIRCYQTTQKAYFEPIKQS